MTSTHRPLRELEARHSLLNLSVYDLVEDDTATRKTRIKARAQLIKRQRLELEAQLRKASEEEELDSLLDSDDYCSDSSPDINPKDNLEDEEATTAKNLSLCESRDGNRTLHFRRNKRTIKLPARAYILYFKELLSDNSRIFTSVIGITRTQAIVLLAIIGHVHFKN
ncbi:hypothetical protein HBH71_247710 [Parastagonospora nodorum]|nr:hypothetical protein HBH71_247710 [Parastagonospora nodorum]